MNIAFAGLTAAGKTTHARLLASQIGYGYISATEIIADILGLPRSDATRLWFGKLGEITSLRKSGDDLDVELERRLNEIASTSTSLVLDTWAMPWICSTQTVNVWIESTPETRAWKCYVSQGEAKSLSIAECADLIEEKDRTTREIFLRRHDFDLYVDRRPFNAILDNSDLISAPTREACDQGISQFAPTVLDAVVESLDSVSPSWRGE